MTICGNFTYDMLAMVVFGFWGFCLGFFYCIIMERETVSWE